MSRNIYIWWDRNIPEIPEHIVSARNVPVGAKKDMPGRDAVLRDVREYIGNFGAEVWQHAGQGHTVVTFRTSFVRYAGEAPVQRYFEIHVSDTTVNVVTRNMDDITNAIATGLAQRLARKFRGRYDDR